MVRHARGLNPDIDFKTRRHDGSGCGRRCVGGRRRFLFYNPHFTANLSGTLWRYGASCVLSDWSCWHSISARITSFTWKNGGPDSVSLDFYRYRSDEMGQHMRSEGLISRRLSSEILTPAWNITAAGPTYLPGNPSSNQLSCLENCLAFKEVCCSRLYLKRQHRRA
jgi:hypothetical protein